MFSQFTPDNKMFIYPHLYPSVPLQKLILDYEMAYDVSSGGPVKVTAGVLGYCTSIRWHRFNFAFRRQDLPALPLRSTGQLRSTYWAPLIWIIPRLDTNHTTARYVNPLENLQCLYNTNQ